MICLQFQVTRGRKPRTSTSAGLAKRSCVRWPPSRRDAQRTVPDGHGELRLPFFRVLLGVRGNAGRVVLALQEAAVVVGGGTRHRRAGAGRR
jgi:hypothetical protein